MRILLKIALLECVFRQKSHYLSAFLSRMRELIVSKAPISELRPLFRSRYK